jgi:hypothetical protein
MDELDDDFLCIGSCDECGVDLYPGNEDGLCEQCEWMLREATEEDGR